MPKFEVFDVRIVSALNRIIHNSQFKRRISLEEQKAQKEDRFLRGRQIAYLIYEYFRVIGAMGFYRELCRLICNCSSKWWYSGIRFKVGRNSIINDANPIWWHLGKCAQIKNTGVWEIQDRIGTVKYGDSSEESWTWLSQEEDNGEQNHRADSTNQEFWGQKRKLWNKRRGQESGDKTAWTKKSRRIRWHWKANGQCVDRETMALSATMSMSVEKLHHQILVSEFFSCSRMRRNASENSKSQRKESQCRMVSMLLQELLERNLHHSILWKMASSRMLCSTSPENGCRLGEKCSYAHR